MININALLNVVGMNTSQVNGSINQLNNKLGQGSKNANTFSDSLALKGVSLAKYTAVSGAIVRLSESISKAFRESIRFELELAKIAQTTGDSVADINKHSDSIRKMSIAYGLSAPKIAETIRTLAQAGYTFSQAKEAADELSKTTLLASFESITDTTDGLIAVNKQFINTMGQSAKVLSVFNVIAKKYAVESSDLVEAAKKAGGVFAATGGTFEELVAIMTTVRDTTRESAETIATGLRTIFSRIQRPKSIEFFREMGIELTDLKGNFVGNFEAIKAIQEGLQKRQIKPGSLGFAQVVEELGGLRQASRVIPLLTQASKLTQIYADTQNAASQTAADLAKAQETLSVRLAQTQQSFSKLFGDILQTDSFKAITTSVLSLTNAFIKLADSAKDFIPYLALIGGARLAVSSYKIATKTYGFAKGGRVPGSGSKDTIPAMLTPNEVVMNVSSANLLGREKLIEANQHPERYEVKRRGRKDDFVTMFTDGGGAKEEQERQRRINLARYNIAQNEINLNKNKSLSNKERQALIKENEKLAAQVRSEIGTTQKTYTTDPAKGTGPSLYDSGKSSDDKAAYRESIRGLSEEEKVAKRRELRPPKKNTSGSSSPVVPSNQSEREAALARNKAFDKQRQIRQLPGKKKPVLPLPVNNVFEDDTPPPRSSAEIKADEKIASKEREVRVVRKEQRVLRAESLSNSRSYKNQIRRLPSTRGRVINSDFVATQDPIANTKAEAEADKLAAQRNKPVRNDVASERSNLSNATGLGPPGKRFAGDREIAARNDIAPDVAAKQREREADARTAEKRHARQAQKRKERESKIVSKYKAGRKVAFEKRKADFILNRDTGFTLDSSVKSPDSITYNKPIGPELEDKPKSAKVLREEDAAKKREQKAEEKRVRDENKAKAKPSSTRTASARGAKPSSSGPSAGPAFAGSSFRPGPTIPVTPTPTPTVQPAFAGPSTRTTPNTVPPPIYSSPIGPVTAQQAAQQKKAAAQAASSQNTINTIKSQGAYKPPGSKPDSSSGLSVALIAGLAKQYVSQESAMGRVTAKFLDIVTTLAIVQASLAAFGVGLSAKGIGDFLSGKGLGDFAGVGKAGKAISDAGTKSLAANAAKNVPNIQAAKDASDKAKAAIAKADKLKSLKAEAADRLSLARDSFNSAPKSGRASALKNLTKSYNNFKVLDVVSGGAQASATSAIAARTVAAKAAGGGVSGAAGAAGAALQVKFGAALTQIQPALTNAAKLAGPMLAAGASVYAFGKIIDSAAGYEQKRLDAIEAGDSSTAKKETGLSTVQNDITNFSTGLAVASTAILAFIPGINLFAPVIGGAIGALAKLAGQLPLVEGAFIAVRNKLAELGFADSTDLIEAKEGSKAAEVNRGKIIEKTAEGVTRQQGRLAKGSQTGADFFKSQEFKALTGGADTQFREDNTIIRESLKQSELNANTGGGGKLLDFLGTTTSFGYAESLAETNTRLAKDVDDARARKTQAGNEVIEKSRPFLTSEIEKFAAGGGTDIKTLLKQIFPDDKEGKNFSRELILSSGKLQVLQQELTDSATIQAVEKAERLRLVGVFENEQKLISSRIALQAKLDESFNKILQTSERVSSAFGLLEQNADLAGTAKVNGSSSQLSDLNNVTDEAKFNKIIGSVTGANPELQVGVAQINKARTFSSAIKAPGGLLAAAQKGAISRDEFKAKITDPTNAPKERELLAGQSKGLKDKLTNLGVDEGVRDSIITKFEDMLKDNQGTVSQTDIQKLLEDNLVGPAQETAGKFAQAYDKQIEALNQFSNGLRLVSEAESKVAASKLESANSSIGFTNTLKELQSGKKTTAAALQEQNEFRQTQILGGPSQSPADTAKEINDLQKSISDSNAKIEADPTSSKDEILAREANIQRMNQLNQSLDEQIRGYGEVRDALLAVATAEKEKAKNLRDELLSETSRSIEDRDRGFKADSFASLALEGDPRFDPRQLTTGFLDRLPPELREKATKDVEAVKASLAKISEDDSDPRQEQAKLLRDKIAEEQQKINAKRAEQVGFKKLSPAEEIQAKLARDKFDRDEASSKKKEEYNKGVSDNRLNRSNPDELSRIKDLRERSETNIETIRNRQTKKGRLSERGAVGQQIKLDEANKGKTSTLQGQSDILRDSFSRLNLEVDKLTNNLRPPVNPVNPVNPANKGALFSLPAEVLSNPSDIRRKAQTGLNNGPAPVNSVAAMDFSSFTNSVNNLIAMPKVIDVKIADVSVSVNHNGLEVFNAITSEVEKMILRAIVDNFRIFKLDNPNGNFDLARVGSKKIPGKV